MVYIAGLLGFLLVLTVDARVGSSSESEVCGKETKECLLHTPLCQGKDYEVRLYDSTKWVSTDETCVFMGWATMKAFRRLFKYITGANADGVKIDMTAPVVVKVENKPLFEKKNFTMSFLLPSQFQLDPPEPTDDKLYINTLPATKVYVRSYGGWMMSGTDSAHARTLRGKLDEAAAQYNSDFHYGVGYDSPWKMTNRRNEVWFVVQGEPVCPPASP